MSGILMMVGPALFTIAPMNLQGVKKTGKVEFAKHKVLGASPVIEDTGGPENVEMTITGKVHPYAFGGLGAIAALEAVKEAKTPVPVMRGDFTALGWFLVVEVSESHSEIGAVGVGSEIEVSVSLMSIDTPGSGLAGAIFSIFG